MRASEIPRGNVAPKMLHFVRSTSVWCDSLNNHSSVFFLMSVSSIPSVQQAHQPVDCQIPSLLCRSPSQGLLIITPPAQVESWPMGQFLFPYSFIFSYFNCKNHLHSRDNARTLGAMLYIIGCKLLHGSKLVYCITSLWFLSMSSARFLDTILNHHPQQLWPFSVFL